ncbi:MAG: DUF5606 domain-containing protein [Cytophagales bacterium]|nr:DUF5606 domain-containing protein [Cytophagales bacterium]MDW8385144.1 DUF5606 domain-containing protein [Flammeovirgaceae bacterium]
MTFQEIAAIAGKPGLYRILKPTRTGVIVEALQEKPTKFAVDAHQRISILSEVSVYVTGMKEESVPLVEVFKNIRKEYGDTLDVDAKNTMELMAFFKTVLPHYNKEKVYPSDVRKIVQWYGILCKFAADVFNEPTIQKSDEQISSSDSTGLDSKEMKM